MVEQLPHCDLLRLSLLTGDLSCQLDKSSKSYCKNSSTFPGFLKVVFFDPKRYIFHPTRRMSDLAAVGFSALRFLHFFQVWLKFKYSAYNLTSFTQNVGFGGRQNFRKTLHLSPSISDSIWRHSAFLGNHTVGYNKWDLLKFIFFHLFQKNYLKMGAAPIFFRKIFFHFGKIYLINFLLGVRGPQY